MAGLTKVCFPYAASAIGGSYLSSLLLIQNLRSRGYEPVIVLHEMGPFTDLLDESGVGYKHLPIRPGYVPRRFTGGLNDMYRAFRPVSDYIAGNRIALVHTQDVLSLYLWSVPSWHQGVPLLAHWRSNYHHRPPLWLSLALAKKLVCVSHYSKQRLPEFAGRRAEVVTNPFSLPAEPPCRETMRPKLLCELSRGEDTIIAGMFANFAPRKRQDLFVDIIHQARAMAPDLELVGLIFGEPRSPTTERVRDRIERLGLSNNVRLMGFRMPGEQWMAGCDIVLAPAINEPYGRSIVESMLVGTPIIAARSGGNPEIIDHGVSGLLVEPDNSEAFAQELIGLAREPERRRRLQSNAVAKANKRYSSEHHVDRIAEIYREILFQDRSSDDR